MELAIGEIALAGAIHVEPAFIRGYVDFEEGMFTTTNASRLRATAEAAGLGIKAVSAHLDLSGPDAVDALSRRIAFAAGLGASSLITNAGPMTKRAGIRKAIDAVLPRLEQSGVALALENPGHGRGDLLGNARMGASFVRDIGSRLVRLNHDAGNVFTYSHEATQPAEDIATAIDTIGHAHLKDVVSRDAGWTFCALGEGAVDYLKYWRMLPPALPVSIEMPLRLERPQRRDPQRRKTPVDIPTIRATLQRSLRFVNSLEAARNSAV
ncbi:MULTISPECIES: sugar phosphate isomerase/epimerase family protein [unclassified Mesorhizobium]|uniref:sugar phosphate isomerase/epimerase family protein n=1 Tax=unclassified Mesorhizobium TaxID=325217 RepID=UPI001CC9A2B1|nr:MULTISPECIES: sugar phosphate isomerase/epimerase [unclassified Mesorhizobium]MBZ9734535.1 sugar phosphate isomerase/epimerase [Mesorhizobium sp. CA9]MBZ9768887.1 sugar phosphate isomerase/epimerase [Mesorhizobium sp. CA6]MBZ9812140.1 sugar phosphate isomerase/epimerase [Mesorhizobium sp. CA7]MBZ9826929.1 sugar phosphate isomerase/epimerase [Mesorhizobium sp. CA18]MBZ9832449.1 sugar phosphate isomerase/epimerase [Mesorhizobium sp. CA2]